MMKYSELKELIRMDQDAYGRSSKSYSIDFIKRWFKTPGFQVTTIMRVCKWLEGKKLLYIFYLINRVYYRHLQVKYGIQIGHRLCVGGGIMIGHFGGIVIGSGAVIGKNLSIRNNLTIGHSGGKTPIIGDNVIVGSNAVIVGAVRIGDNAIIGAGSVVVRDVEKNKIVVGNPAHVVGERKEGIAYF